MRLVFNYKRIQLLSRATFLCGHVNIPFSSNPSEQNMSTEPASKTRSAAKKDKQDAPAKGGKAAKSGPSPKVQELNTEEKEEVKLDPGAFQVAFYMKHFRVSDIIVKVADGAIIIDACHREHADEHGLVSRSMIRKHKLPKNIKLDTLTSAFTGNGFLVIHGEHLVEKDPEN